ncbi:hypothetical protein HCA00_02450 [Listeria booriae]|uniref:hypothetical protein n=1 Tax=Listeria booriae TaxID=1552123 RepID=UPI0016253368|nr:hypothetical protein [Listeria booriae]MBC2256958.1 hypothetical protein [Listeria booriae]MBC6127646.1 hypothetical protein [Listeria booriae]
MDKLQQLALKIQTELNTYRKTHADSTIEPFYCEVASSQMTGVYIYISTTDNRYGGALLRNKHMTHKNNNPKPLPKKYKRIVEDYREELDILLKEDN